MIKNIIRTGILICSFLSTATVVQAAMQIQHWTDTSGAEVYFVPSPSLPMLDVQVDFAAGEALDPSPKSGLASLTLHLLDAGAGNLDEYAIADQLADIGAQLGGGIDKDRLHVSIRTLSEPVKRDAALALLHSLITAPKFEAAILERERARLIASLREQATQPAAILERRFQQLAYGTHPYGQQATEGSLSAIQRDDLVQFHQRYFSAARSVITIVGDAKRAEAEKIAHDLSTGLPVGVPRSPLDQVSPPKAQQVHIPHSASQAHIELGMPVLTRDDPDYFPLLVGNYVLGGGGFSSRLMEEVRDKRGLTYGVQSYFAPMQRAGLYSIGLQTQASQAGAALKVVRETINNFLQNGPSEQELASAKANLINGFALRLDSSKKILEHVAVLGFYKLPLDFWASYPKRIEAVTVAQIKDAFKRRVLQDNLVTVIVGGEGEGL